jgi:hypothetical protein
VVARRLGRYLVAEVGGFSRKTYAAVAQEVSKAEERITMDKATASICSVVREYLKTKDVTPPPPAPSGLRESLTGHAQPYSCQLQRHWDLSLWTFIRWL